MSSARLSTPARALLAFAIVAGTACDSGTSPAAPALTALSVSLPAATITYGQPDTATAVGVDQTNATMAVGTITWSSSSTAIATVSTTGVVTGVAAGTAQIVATASGVTGQKAVTVTAPPGIRVNEVESNGGTPGDWAEFYNPTATAVDLSGWVMKDNDDTHSFTFPAGTSIGAGKYLVVDETLQFTFGLGAPDAVRLFNPFGALVDAYDWTAHAAVTYGRCPSGTGSFTNNTTPTRGAANDCSIPFTVVINEVESSGGVPDDWIEFYNTGTTTQDLTGYIVRDNDDTHTYTFPAGSTLAPGAYLTLDIAPFFGLGSADAARLFKPDGVTLVDSYDWTAHAATTYGRCPNGTGAFVTTSASTKNAVNACTGGQTLAAWPGTDNVTTIDGTAVFGGNLSGLMYEAAAGSAAAVLWGARNGTGTPASAVPQSALFRLIFNGTIWTPDPANSWSLGKALHYPDGTGEPDAEDVTFAGSGSAAGLFVVSERNNVNNGVSRPSILRYDPTATTGGASLTATNEWNLTADLPVVGANLGLEGIAWIPDTFLTGQGFFDEAAGHTYNPADYANHGTGLFFVGLEANGMIYAYALNQSTNAFTRVATIASPFVPAAVMALQFDRELNYLWVACDDGCGGLTGTLEIDATVGSATKGKFIPTHQFARPTTMPNYNNEGFAVTPQALCVNGFKPVYWADDTEDGGHAIRTAMLPCVRFP